MIYLEPKRFWQDIPQTLKQTIFTNKPVKPALKTPQPESQSQHVREKA